VKFCVLLLAALLLGACKRSDSALSDTASIHSPVTVPAPLDTGSIDTGIVASRNCGVIGTPVLTDEGIGELRQGRPVSEVAALCDVISDSQQRGPEGTMERVLVVRIAGESVRAVVENDRIWRIEISSPRFRTADSLGVDAPLKFIAAKRGAQFHPGEGGVYGFVRDHCGLSFRFSVPLMAPSSGHWTPRTISEVHGDAAVERVLVTACRN